MALNIIIEGQATLGVTTGMPASISVQMGTPGASATVDVGTTTTGDAGTDATVVNVGTLSAAIFDFTIPRGDKGDAGSPGQGVATGGTAGQILAKLDSSNYSTHWINQPTSGVWGQITGDINSQTDLQSALAGKLDLYGGTLTGILNITDPSNEDNYTKFNFTAIDIYKSGIGNVVELADWGLGVSDTNGGSGGHTSEIRPEQILVKTDNVGITLTSSAITFSDGSTQASAYNPAVLANYLPLAGGTMSANASVSFTSNVYPEAPFLNFTVNNGEDADFGGSISGGSFNFYDNNQGGTLTGHYYYGYTHSNDDGLTVNLSYNGITFNDTSLQTTAFIPSDWLSTSAAYSTFLTQSSAASTYQPISSMSAYLSTASAASTYYPIPTGTTSQYIRGDGSKATYGPLGDRYLTSSTTSLTISNSTKTLTIGTGLSYSTQQDVTIAYDASNHMHATVTSYNSSTGVMVADVYNKSGSGTYTAWTVNVGGVVGGSYLQTSNNLSELTATASTARTNLGLGAVATDGYATTAQAQAGTSTTTVINPSTLLDAKIFAGYKPLSLVYTWTSSVSGTGASTTVSGQLKNVYGPTSAVGSAMAYIINYNAGRGIASAIGADFTKRTIIGGRFIKTVTTADANSVFRFLLGKNFTSPSAGDLAQRGIGFRQVANGALELQVHNGTTLYNVTSSFTPTANQSYDVVIIADGGTATMYVNGSSVATSANAPTATLGSTVGILDIEAQNTSVLSGSAMTYSSSDIFVQTNL
jgi:hypothetical protein